MLHGVFRRLEPQHLQGAVHVGAAVVLGDGLLKHVEVLSAHQLGPHRVEGRAPRRQGGRRQSAGGEQLFAPGQAEVAGERRGGLAEPFAVAGPAEVVVHPGHVPV